MKSGKTQSSSKHGQKIAAKKFKLFDIFENEKDFGRKNARN